MKDKKSMALFTTIVRDKLSSIQTTAAQYGYAITLNGLLTYKVDLVAIPWVPDAKPPIDMVTAVIGLFDDGFTVFKPHRRTRGKMIWRFNTRDSASITITVVDQPHAWLDMSSVPIEGTMVDLYISGVGRLANCQYRTGKWLHYYQLPYNDQTKVIETPPVFWQPIIIPKGGDIH